MQLELLLPFIDTTNICICICRDSGVIVRVGFHMTYCWLDWDKTKRFQNLDFLFPFHWKPSWMLLLYLLYIAFISNEFWNFVSKSCLFEKALNILRIWSKISRNKTENIWNFKQVHLRNLLLGTVENLKFFYFAPL